MIEGRANVLPVQARDTRGNFFEVYILGNSINPLTISQVGEQHGCVRRSFLLIRKLESRRDSESEECQKSVYLGSLRQMRLRLEPTRPK